MNKIGIVRKLSLGSQKQRAGWITANESGALTISVGYGLTTVVATDVSRAGQGVLLQLSELAGGFNDVDTATLDARFGAASRTGTLVSTIMMSAGEIARFSLSAGTGGDITSVPEPDMLWPMLIGMVGIAILAERRRHRSYRHNLWCHGGVLVSVRTGRAPSYSPGK